MFNVLIIITDQNNSGHANNHIDKTMNNGHLKVGGQFDIIY